ncbi:MAG: T9SS type A sorting domain-containing protein [Bacteroidetes bacterium]|nr:T9SS type A sorting domain-containing protein [Bacteroidota bacterium]
MNRNKKWILPVIALLLASVWSYAQTATSSTHTTVQNIKLGPFSGNYFKPIVADGGGLIYREFQTNEYKILSTTVSETNTANMRLFLSDVNLGANSFIQLISLYDNGTQRLDNKSIEDWYYSSAFFNGDAVEVQLWVAPGDNNVMLKVASTFAIEGFLGSPESQCGTTDDRVASSDKKVGRLMPVGCTGWQISNGRFVTAGHCTGNMSIMEFNVPSSTSNGTTVAASPSNQYPVVANSIVFQNTTGTGNDWCTYNVNPNSNTGKLPNEANGVFNAFDQTYFRCTKDVLPGTSGSTTRITGFGVDFVPSGTGGGPCSGCNASSQTNQTSAGPFVSETGSTTAVGLNYTVDTEGGNSGSPVIINNTLNTVGIHTNAGCVTNNANPGANAGTSFEEDDLETAVQNALGTGHLYIDENHPSATASGTVMRPYKTVNAAVTAAAANNTLNIVEGAYTETVITTKTLVMRAPVGLVVIGPSAFANLETRYEEQGNETSSNSASSTNDVAVMPNPFANNFTMTLDLNSERRCSAYITNMAGAVVKVVFSDKVFDQGQQQISVDCSELADGSYFIVVNDGEKILRSKINKLN